MIMIMILTLFLCERDFDGRSPRKRTRVERAAVPEPNNREDKLCPLIRRTGHPNQLEYGVALYLPWKRKYRSKFYWTAEL